MKRIFGLSWRRSALMVICLVFTLGLKDVTSQEIACYSCTDRGEGGCLPENAANISCSANQDMCVELITAVRSSHHTFIVLNKGCSSGEEAKLDKAMSYHGISIFNQMNQCNTSLCNTDMDLKKYLIAEVENTTHLPSDEKCYSCIGKPDEECSPSTAPAMQCHSTINHCFDGKVTISVDNNITVIPVKSCTSRFHCVPQTLTYGTVSIEIKGACCSGDRCNQDLSNQTQLIDLPFLVLLDENKEEVTPTVLPPPWLTPAITLATTKGVEPRDGEDTPNTADSSNQAEGSESNNMAFGLVYSPWLIFILICLS
ncbi:ly6/PLAUR domain-containing protein 3-like [Eleutherodactylus coqui]|uniref:ly6/PLAUR domain-containing protein 3-like n=1 Tax=Eleutherodactylus coqui TaxID=57060 RepID=UPI0034621928